MAEALKAGPGALVLDFQGPFAPRCDLIKGSEPFVAVRLFDEPDVAIYVTSDDDADALIKALNQAKRILARARRASG